ncbi:hypothetical protein DKT69_00995 [Micromonospora sicca]|uniref:Uncharacterized protein n=2 Tax=Micromonospora sicca TaxID=2202420 RepID=A0A317DSE2_9ACTN|nr:hypothetical protein DKT69_00995 [Micromonospora sp. 4G51]
MGDTRMYVDMSAAEVRLWRRERQADEGEPQPGLRDMPRKFFGELGSVRVRAWVGVKVGEEAPLLTEPIAAGADVLGKLAPRRTQYRCRHMGMQRGQRHQRRAVLRFKQHLFGLCGASHEADSNCR